MFYVKFSYSSPSFRRVLCGVFLLSIGAVESRFGDAYAQAPSPPVPTEVAPSNNSAWEPLAVPSTASIEELSKFVESAKKRQPQTLEHYLEMQRAIREASKRTLDLLKEPSASGYAAAEFDFVASSVMLLANDGPQAQEKTFEKFRDYLKNRDELNIHDLRMALLAGQNLEQFDDVSMAKRAYTEFAEILEARKRDEFTEMIELFRASVRRLELPGNTAELQGKLMSDGSDWSLENQRGKLVLAIVWSASSGPSLDDLKVVKRLYAAYKPRGLEVVGICLESDKATIQKIRDELQLTWAELWDEQSPGTHEFVKKYGISTVPTMMLFDIEGKALAIQARGQTLPVLLDRIFNPPPAETPQ